VPTRPRIFGAHACLSPVILYQYAQAALIPHAAACLVAGVCSASPLCASSSGSLITSPSIAVRVVFSFSASEYMVSSRDALVTQARKERIWHFLSWHNWLSATVAAGGRDDVASTALRFWWRGAWLDAADAYSPPSPYLVFMATRYAPCQPSSRLVLPP